MDFLRRIEDDVRNLGVETKRKHPEVREAAERGLTALRTMREAYVAELMKNKSSGLVPKIAKYRSADIAAPYVLVCNYADTNSKIVLLALNGLQMILNYEVVPPSEVQNILRVLSIQASTGKTDIQLKVLQVVLQLANALAVDPTSIEFLTTSVIGTMLSVSLQLCDSSRYHSSVVSSAFATVRQLMAIIMDDASENLLPQQQGQRAAAVQSPGQSPAKSMAPVPNTNELPKCAELFIKDLSNFAKGLPGEWLNGAAVVPNMAMDLIYEVISGWKRLFQEVAAFRAILSSHLSPCMKPYLRNLRDDYLVVLKSEEEMLVNLMMHSILPEKMGIGAMLSGTEVPRQIIGIDDGNKLRYDDGSVQIVGLGTGVAGALAGGLMRLAISAQGGIKSAAAGAGGSSSSGGSHSSARGSGLAGSGFLALCTNPGGPSKLSPGSGVADSSPMANSYSAYSSNSGANDIVYVPSYPIAVCLETVMALFLSDRATDVMAMGLGGVDAVKTIYTSVIHTVSTLLNEAFAVDNNVRDFELAVKTSHLAGVLENLFCGSSDSGVSENRDAVCRFVHDQVHSPSGISTAEVLVLAFHVLQVTTRALVRGSLQCTMAMSKEPSTRASPVGASAGTSSELVVNSTGGSGDSLTISIDAAQAQAAMGPQHFFVPRSVLLALPFPTDQLLTQVLNTSGRAVVEKTGGKVRDICMSMLLKVEDTVVIRRCVGIITEYVLATGFLGLHELCNSLVFSMCRCALPVEHSVDRGVPVDRGSGSGNGSALSSAQIDRNFDPPMLRWRNVQAFVRLSQAVHALADNIVNWEVIVDCFVQIVYIITSQRGISDDVTPHEIDKVFYAIHRFHEYSAFFSEEALIRLTTALVCLSMHTVEASTVSLDSGRSSSVTSVSDRTSGRLGAPLLSSVSGAAKDVVHRIVSTPESGSITRQPQQATVSSGDSSRILPSSTSSHFWSKAPPYLMDALASGSLSYALYAIIDIVKANTFRLSCVWHMVSSHLRTVAMNKNGSIRAIAVAATNDLISTALQFMKHPLLPSEHFRFVEDPVWSPPPFPPVGAGGLIQAPLNLTLLVDDLLFNFLLPPFDRVFTPLMFQKIEVLECEDNQVARSKLVQSDLLLSLKALAAVPQADVRNDTIQGLLALLQEGGHAVEGGWDIVFDLLMSIPLSMTIDSGPDSVAAAGSAAAGTATSSISWPKESLMGAFTCMKLVLDDFLEELPYEVIIKAVHCVSAFSAQVQDVNVSLTSIEMLWKVTDYIMTSSRKVDDIATSKAALDVMLSRLSLLSVDSRPEIRNCATNTLFSAILSNANMLSPVQWKSVFDDIIFPLFEATEQKATLAMSSKEEAMTPELKKGVKMTLHHSRDTAHKQWLETRVLALRGTCRAIKAGSRNLSLEPWFGETWKTALGVCLSSLQVSTVDFEVCVASVDMLFDMVKMVATQAYRSKTRAGFGMRVVGGALVSDESNIARTPAELKAAMSASLASSDEREMDGLTEIAREKLWQSAWSTVRDCVCYERIGSDLALHICQHLKDLYCGGMDGEFRYSQNVKSLLELMVCLARPRTGIVLPPPGSSQPSASEQAESGNIRPIEGSVNKKMDKIADSQLVRGVMVLLQTITPVDIVAFSALMSTLAELTFGRSCVEMNYKAKGDGVCSNRSVVLGPVDAKLRLEVGSYMISILSARPQTSVDDESETKNALPSVFNDIPPSWSGVALEVVVRQFVNELCFRPSLKRSMLIGVNTAAERSGRVEAASPNSKKQSAQRAGSLSGGSGIGGFFTSIGKMLTSTLESEDEDSDSDGEIDDDLRIDTSVNSETSAAAAAFRDNMMQDSKGVATTTSGCMLSSLREASGLIFDAGGMPVSAKNDDTATRILEWHPFRTTATDLKILHLVFRNGLRPALLSGSQTLSGDKNAATSKKNVEPSIKLSYKQQCVWSHVLTSVLCILSPWREMELSAAHAPESRSGLSQTGSIAATSEIPSDGISFAGDVIAAVGAVVTFLIDSREALPTDLTLQLVDSICACCRIAVVALKASIVAIEACDTPPPLAQVLTQTYLGVLDYCRGFMSILSSSQQLSRVVRKRSIRGALFITRDLMTTVEEVGHASAECGVETIYIACAKYLDMLVDMDTSIDLLPDEEIAGLAVKPGSASTRSQPPSFQNLLVEWNSVLARSLSGIEVGNGSSSAVSSSETRSESQKDARAESTRDFASPTARSRALLAGTPDVSTEGRKPSNVSKKAHLLLFNNSASRFMSHSSEDLRSSSARLLGSLDMSDVLSVYIDLANRVDMLEKKTTDLEAELKVAKTAIHTF